MTFGFNYHSLVCDEISAVVVFKRKQQRPTCGFVTDYHWLEFIERDKLTPETWPRAADGSFLTMIGVIVDLGAYVGQIIRISHTPNGCGFAGELSYDETRGYIWRNIEFGIADVKNVSIFTETHEVENKDMLKIQL